MTKTTTLNLYATIEDFIATEFDRQGYPTYGDHRDALNHYKVVKAFNEASNLDLNQYRGYAPIMEVITVHDEQTASIRYTTPRLYLRGLYKDLKHTFKPTEELSDYQQVKEVLTALGIRNVQQVTGLNELPLEAIQNIATKLQTAIAMRNL